MGQLKLDRMSSLCPEWVGDSLVKIGVCPVSPVSPVSPIIIDTYVCEGVVLVRFECVM